MQGRARAAWQAQLKGGWCQLDGMDRHLQCSLQSLLEWHMLPADICTTLSCCIFGTQVNLLKCNVAMWTVQSRYACISQQHLKLVLPWDLFACLAHVSTPQEQFSQSHILLSCYRQSARQLLGRQLLSNCWLRRMLPRCVQTPRRPRGSARSRGSKPSSTVANHLTRLKTQNLSHLRIFLICQKPSQHPSQLMLHHLPIICHVCNIWSLGQAVLSAAPLSCFPLQLNCQQDHLMTA